MAPETDTTSQDGLWPALLLRDGVDCNTIVDTDTTSYSALMASCFLELEKPTQELRGKLHNDFTNILDGMASINLSSTAYPPSPSPSPPSRSSSLVNGTSFITEAYAWLLENIADPYPSSTVKTSLAERHNCTLSSVNSWFINARRRMGWTALCRDYFHNCRADALDAAYRALVEEDPNRHLKADIAHAFFRVKIAAEELYSSTLTKSALACHLDTIVKDMSDVSSNEPELSEPKETTTNMDFQNNTSAAQNCYPSPDRSPILMPVPAPDTSLTEGGEDNDGVLPATLAGRKRRLSSSVASQTATSDSTTRLVKRPRSSASSMNACLPSPAMTAEDSLGDDQMPRSDPVTQDIADSRTRKRRLSDADANERSKRPRDSVTEPHLHAVSDPLPLSDPESEYSIDQWFKANFDDLFSLPPPVDVAEPDILTQWEVELFNNYTLPENSETTFIPPIQDNQLLPSPDLTTLDELFQSLERDAFAAPLETAHPPVVTPVPDSVPQGLSDLSDLSQPIDWTALLNEDPFGFGNNSMFPQPYDNSALPEMDLSMIQLPQVWTPVAS